MGADDKVTNGQSILVLGAIVLFFSFLIISGGQALLNSEEAELSDNSVGYIINLTGASTSQNSRINYSILNSSNPDAIESASGTNKNDFSLDFVFGQSTGSKIANTLRIIFGIPQFIAMDIFGLPEYGIIKYTFYIINWVFNIAIFIALVRAVRGRL